MAIGYILGGRFVHSACRTLTAKTSRGVVILVPGTPLCCASGFVMSLLYSTLSVFPIIEVASWRIFALKIFTVILVANVIGVAIYFGGRAKKIM